MTENHKDNRYEHGVEILKGMMGKNGDKIIDELNQLHPDIAHFVIAGYADIFGRPGLEKKERAIVILTALIVQGQTDQLYAHTYTALNLGLTPNEILEVIIQCTAYIGFPRSLSALKVVQEVLKENGLEFNK
ncbi:carboxymuconolactone decarboxylase family protein [Niallia endozanthoxylica]|uniref:Carboxymuconolactone decarboxylase family protein n=1 Tax=Niallia endozanthoxylica TaxID=2036016 RepID=A0A5J5HZM2_9BACI|nr:carboxymuconolactone decarboxylase family protein [Niallia endozanthoxylica]KAA9028497.1 carboxymuconolactone decarboxylase family protein [Niallia endozanthoxylica]